MQVAASWREAIEAALTGNPSLETWQGHFRHRLPEFEELLQYWPRKRVDSALEIGCGNGLAAVYFSPLVGKIVASDLAEVDHQAHSIGLEFAKKFFREMKLENAEVLGCSAEKIPLANRSFDLVYGIYCLEHIPDRAAALKETMRVLRPGGEALFTVPGAAWALVFPLGFYHELAQRILKRIYSKVFRAAGSGGTGNQGAPAPAAKVTGASSFFKHYPHFPFPEPHGTHSSWPAEISFYRRSNWERLVREAGFSRVEIQPISFVPKMVRAVLPATATAKLESWLKRSPAALPFAQFFCIRARVE